MGAIKQREHEYFITLDDEHLMARKAKFPWKWHLVDANRGNNWTVCGKQVPMVTAPIGGFYQESCCKTCLKFIKACNLIDRVEDMAL